MSLTYRQAGVDIDAGAELIQRIAGACKATHRRETLGGLGGFAALSEIPSGYVNPVLVAGTDGVGTKLRLAMEFDRHDAIGQDLVAMCANDVLAAGAEPFLFLDYYATGRLDLDLAERVIKGIAKGCALAGCALAGGETAEMPGFYAGGDYDLAGFCLGVAERERILDGRRATPGDRLLGLAASGPHANGYSLIRRLLQQPRQRPGAKLLEALLAPTRIYVKPILRLLAEIEVHGLAHITGGGIIDNVPRLLGDRQLIARVRLDAWQRPPVFDWLQQAAGIDEAEMLRTFNCGIGFVACVPAADASRAAALLRECGEAVTDIGEIALPGAEAEAGELLLHG